MSENATLFSSKYWFIEDNWYHYVTKSDYLNIKSFVGRQGILLFSVVNINSFPGNRLKYSKSSIPIFTSHILPKRDFLRLCLNSFCLNSY